MGAFHQEAIAEHDANGRPLMYPGPDGKMLYIHGYPVGWLEVHTHHSISNRVPIVLQHSHNEERTSHDGYGPAAFTVCADCWRGKTGIKGGGQKRFTAKPWGTQL